MMIIGSLLLTAILVFIGLDGTFLTKNTIQYGLISISGNWKMNNTR